MDAVIELIGSLQFGACAEDIAPIVATLARAAELDPNPVIREFALGGLFRSPQREAFDAWLPLATRGGRGGLTPESMEAVASMASELAEKDTAEPAGAEPPPEQLASLAARHEELARRVADLMEILRSALRTERDGGKIVASRASLEALGTSAIRVTSDPALKQALERLREELGRGC